MIGIHFAYIVSTTKIVYSNSWRIYLHKSTRSYNTTKFFVKIEDSKSEVKNKNITVVNGAKS